MIRNPFGLLLIWADNRRQFIDQYPSLENAMAAYKELEPTGQAAVIEDLLTGNETWLPDGHRPPEESLVRRP